MSEIQENLSALVRTNDAVGLRAALAATAGRMGRHSVVLLNTAIVYKSHDALEVLIEHGAWIKGSCPVYDSFSEHFRRTEEEIQVARTSNGADSPLAIAGPQNDEILRCAERLQSICKNGPAVRRWPLLIALAHRNRDATLTLLRAGVSAVCFEKPDSAKPFRYCLFTPLCVACAVLDVELVRIILENGGNNIGENMYLWSTLTHVAVGLNDAESVVFTKIIRLLLLRGSGRSQWIFDNAKYLVYSFFGEQLDDAACMIMALWRPAAVAEFFFQRFNEAPRYAVHAIRWTARAFAATLVFLRAHRRRLPTEAKHLLSDLHDPLSVQFLRYMQYFGAKIDFTSLLRVLRVRVLELPDVDVLSESMRHGRIDEFIVAVKQLAANSASPPVPRMAYVLQTCALLEQVTSPFSRDEVLEMSSVAKDVKRRIGTAAFAIFRDRLAVVCMALQGMRLPSLVLVHLLNALQTKYRIIPMHLKWRLIATIRHFHERKQQK